MSDDQSTKMEFDVVSDDPELQTIHICVKAIEALCPEHTMKNNVTRYLLKRFA